MADDPRILIRDLLADTADPYAPLRILRVAVEWSAATLSSALTDQRAEPGEDVAILELVFAVDDALTEVDALVAAVPRLSEHALTGAPVDEYLRQQTATLAGLSERARVTRHAYEAAQAVAAELRAEADEHDRLTNELAEFDRLRALSESLPELREQHERLRRRADAIVVDTEEAEQALLETVESFLTLRAETVSLLSERTRDALHELQATESRWGALTREHAQATEKVERLHDAHTVRTAELTRHADVDRDLLQRLTAATGERSFSDNGKQTLTRIRADLVGEVHTRLDQAQQLLDRVDQGLAAALTRYQEIGDSERRELGWRDD